MKVKTIVTLTPREKEVLTKRIDAMRTMCNDLSCPCTTCENCPFDAISDRIHDAAHDLAEILSKCKVEGE